MAKIQSEWTPLLLASSKHHTDVVEMLTKHGAQLDTSKVTILTLYKI